MRNSTLRSSQAIAFLLTALAFSVSALSARAEEAGGDGRSAEAVEILKKAGQAASKVSSVRFETSTKPTGLLAQFVGNSEGKNVFEGWDDELGRPGKFWAHVEGTTPGSDQVQEMTGGGNGDMYFLINHSEKKAYEDMDPGVMGSSGQALLASAILEFVAPAPFENDLKAEKIELRGKTEVAGVECFEIYVELGQPSGEVAKIWKISTGDFLPRGVVRHYSLPPQGEGTLEVVLSELEIDPKLEAGFFKMKLPEGYEQIDDFAP